MSSVNSMSVIRKILFSLIILSLGASVALVMMKLLPKDEETLNEAEKISVNVVQIRPQSVTVEVESQGTVRPITETSLVSEITGVIEWISPKFASGERFEQGEVLVRINPLDYEVAVDQAQASLSAAKAKLLEEQARSEAEKKNWLASGRTLKDAPPLLIRTPLVAEAQARVKAAKAELEKAQLYLQKTQVRAPYSGMVQIREADLGEYVGPGALLGVIFSTRASEVRLPVTASDLEQLGLFKQGGSFNHQPLLNHPVVLSAQLGSFTGRWTATLVRQEGVLDQKTRMYYLVANIDEPYKAPLPLSSGVFVKATMQGKTLADVFVLPRELLRRNNEVLTVNQKNQLWIKTVNVVYTSNGHVYINKGLEAGEKVVFTALEHFIEGQEVLIQCVHISGEIQATPSVLVPMSDATPENDRSSLKNNASLQDKEPEG